MKYRTIVADPPWPQGDYPSGWDTWGDEALEHVAL